MLRSWKGRLMYKIEGNYCNCHPETCCCNNYKITFNGDKIGTAYSVSDQLENMVKLANKALKREMKKNG